MSLNGCVALVTGATRGIGCAIADRLAGEGATVIGTATSQAGAESISAALESKGGAGRVLDVRNTKACEALVDEIGKTFGPIAILVNNAGITRDMIALRLKDEDWNAVIETNLSAVFQISRAVLRPMMKARYGRIISIGSVVGSTGNFGQANYASAKAGMIAMSKCLAAEVGPRNITVNVVAPGFIETDMTKNLGEDIKKKLMDRILIPRLGTTTEVAAAVSFLASRDASYVTGTTLHVNGGMFMA